MSQIEYKDSENNSHIGEGRKEGKEGKNEKEIMGQTEYKGSENESHNGERRKGKEGKNEERMDKKEQV